MPPTTDIIIARLESPTDVTTGSLRHGQSHSNARLLRRHADSQFKHTKHSDARHPLPLPSAAFPWQFALHKSHFVHVLSASARLSKGRIDKSPNNAPVGHAYLHHQRLRNALAASSPTKTTRINSLPMKD